MSLTQKTTVPRIRSTTHSSSCCTQQLLSRVHKSKPHTKTDVLQNFKLDTLPAKLHVPTTLPHRDVVRAFVGDDRPYNPLNNPASAPTDFEKRMQDAGVKYDKFVDDFANWLDKEERLFRDDLDGDGGNGKIGGDGKDWGGDDGGDDGGKGNEGGGSEEGPVFRPRRMSRLPWITACGAVLHFSYVLWEWNGYGNMSYLDLAGGVMLTYGLMWSALELLKIVPNPHVYSIGLGVSLGTIVWTYNRASQGFWELPPVVNAVYFTIVAMRYGLNVAFRPVAQFQAP